MAQSGFLSRGQTALVTGASSGIGAAFARALAERGCGVVLVARSEERMRSLAAELATECMVRADVIAADLSREGAAAAVKVETDRLGLKVDLLVNNAGFGTHGPFETHSPEREHAEVMVNVASVVDLTHSYVPDMLARGHGAIINVASTAAFQPVPYMAVYGATKAFVLSFSEALSVEYRGRGLRVLALCPGGTETSFFEHTPTNPMPHGRTAEQVVATGLAALERGKMLTIDGRMNALGAFSVRFAPRKLVAVMAGRVMRGRAANA